MDLQTHTPEGRERDCAAFFLCSDGNVSLDHRHRDAAGVAGAL
jgi:hypothetical protein